ncbi:MAG: endonuclease III, partial [Armatimonadetes bacterium]|nr:endonuclease III [Armatimonadota bacterium]
MSKIEKVCDALDQEYGRQTWTRRRNVLDELIYTILSQNTTAANCNQAFRELRRRFLTWDQVRLAPTEQIADAIRVGGLADQKAPRIKRILQEISENKAKLNLEWIADKPNDEALSYLTAFEGVGLKTAACVLMFGLGRPVMPVDTHVH